MAAAKRIEIDRDIRKRIIDGLYPPGSRLPTRSKLEKEFAVSSITIQRAVNRLIDDGFVVARGTAGTYVVERPPHLSQISVLFPDKVEVDTAKSLFFKAFWNEVKTVEKELNITLNVVDEYESWNCRDRINSLCSDVMENKLAGLIFASLPYNLAGLPIVEQDGIPRVCISSKAEDDLHSVWHDDNMFFQKSCQFLKQKGCKKPYFILHSNNITLYERMIFENSVGLEIEDKQIQVAKLNDPKSVKNLVDLIFTQKEIPDSLVIGDDNITEIVTQRLKELGFNGVDDIEIISLANFPLKPETALPVTFLGFEANKVLKECVKHIIKMVNNEPYKIQTVLPALFEHEF